jgi:hypothetical protein
LDAELQDIGLDTGGRPDGFSKYLNSMFPQAANVALCLREHRILAPNGRGARHDSFTSNKAIGAKLYAPTSRTTSGRKPGHKLPGADKNRLA